MEPQALVIFLHRRSDATFRPYGSMATSAKCVCLGSANHGRVYRIQRGAEQALLLEHEVQSLLLKEAIEIEKK